MTALEVAAAVVDPELPQLTLAELGVLRDVKEDAGHVTVWITPTYTACPALGAMRDDLVRRLGEAGYDEVDVRVALSPAWSSDWISESGRRKLAEAGIAPPGAAPRRTGPIPLTLGPARRADCPQCGSPDTLELSEFGSTACRALRRCRSCGETFDHFKEI
ncbi:1,2-phenylacetyl-CoA epoxidase subunit PaaD [Nonomuraea sp. NPDC050536]|uniref:1,2-phenylacetyl-CoA epoxidase subunit PaaD n=1 Tax=Nonomuraea sp. NPDC050536 TaxID=3364366 RepID=UPI0037C6A21F